MKARDGKQRISIQHKEADKTKRKREKHGEMEMREVGLPMRSSNFTRNDKIPV